MRLKLDLNAFSSALQNCILTRLNDEQNLLENELKTQFKRNKMHKINRAFLEPYKVSNSPTKLLINSCENVTSTSLILS